MVVVGLAVLVLTVVLVVVIGLVVFFVVFIVVVDVEGIAVVDVLVLVLVLINFGVVLVGGIAIHSGSGKSHVPLSMHDSIDHSPLTIVPFTQCTSTNDPIG